MYESLSVCLKEVKERIAGSIHIVISPHKSHMHLHLLSSPLYIYMYIYLGRPPYVYICLSRPSYIYIYILQVFTVKNQTLEVYRWFHAVAV